MSKRNGNLITTTSEAVLEPTSARALLDRNLQTIERELLKLERISMADANYPLAPEHASVLVNYAKTLVLVDKNKKEFPEDEEDDELKYLSDAELTELAKKVILGKKK